MKSAFRRILLFSFLFIAFSLSAQYRGKLGINLGGGLGDFFVDIAKTTRAWEAPNGGTLPDNLIDPQGWPLQDFRTVLMDHRPVAEWSGTIDDPDVYRRDYSGTYKVSFTGQAEVSVGGDGTISGKQYDPGSNTTRFDLVVGPPRANHALVILTFRNTRRSPENGINSGITGLRVIRPGYQDRPGQVFTDNFLNTLTSVDFSTIRSQSFTGTTSWKIAYPREVSWAERKLPDYAIQGSAAGGKRESAAWEYYIDLCNQAEMDIWVNVPISASTDYVAGLAQLLKDSLDPGRNIYVENDNEIWNSAPAFIGAYDYNQAEAAAMGLTPEQNIARRAVELSQIFAGVFGAEEINGRVRVILASHAPMLKWWVRPMMEYIRDNFGAPHQFIYGISRQTYFGSTNAPAATIPELLQAARADIDAQLGPDPVNEANRSQWAAFAAQWQLPGGVTSYEGGPHFPSGGNLTNLDNQIRAHRDPGMKDLLKYNLADAWWDAGGGLALQFTLYSGYNRYGCWGLTDDLADPDRNAKMAAMRELVNEATGVKRPAESPYRVFPNPAAGFLVVKGPDSGVVDLYLMDLSGRVLLQKDDYQSGNEISLPAFLTDGTYFLRVESERGVGRFLVVLIR